MIFNYICPPLIKRWTNLFFYITPQRYSELMNCNFRKNYKNIRFLNKALFFTRFP